MMSADLTASSSRPPGTSSPRCCPPARSTIPMAATASAFPSASSSINSSRSWCSAAATAGSPIKPARRLRCAAAATNGSPSASLTNCTAWRWPPTTGCTDFTWSSWSSMAASPRRPAVTRSPGQARWTGGSRGSTLGRHRRGRCAAGSAAGPGQPPRRRALLAATLEAAATVTAAVVGPFPAQPVVHLDAAYDCQSCRQVLAERGMVGHIATRGVPAPIQASRRWPVERTHALANQYASCAGVPNADGSWSRSGCCWPWR
jgi:hypothetical protein